MKTKLRFAALLVALAAILSAGSTWAQGTSNGGPYEVDANTLLLLHFDEDIDGEQGETPTLAAGVSLAPGRFGQGLLADESDRLWFDTLGNVALEEGTIEFWIKPNWPGTDPSGHIFLEIGDCFFCDRLRVMHDGVSIRFMTWDSGGESGLAPWAQNWVEGEWHHVGVTWSGNQIALYVDFELLGSGAADHFPMTLTSTIEIGSACPYGEPGCDPAGLQVADGVIDELRISNVVREFELPPPSGIPALERDALIALYNSTGGPNWNSRTNWRNASDTDFNDPGTECTWYGITCSPDGMHVTGLGLIGNNMSGEIPPDLGELSELRGLVLTWNQGLTGDLFHGSTTSWVGRLTKLESFDVIAAGSLSGPIPEEFGDLPSLEMIQLDFNRFEGDVPEALCRSQSLRRLALGFNQLSGDIPDCLGDMTELVTLELYSNRFTGTLPNLGSLTALQFLSLGSNPLMDDEPIPDWLGFLTQLQYLDLRSMHLTSPIPYSLSNLDELRTLFLGGNHLDGTVPDWFGELGQLQELHLDGNQFVGPLPPEIGDIATLRLLDLSNNPLNCEIPQDIGRLTELTHLGIVNSGLHGPIPESIGDLDKLVALALYGNHLNGPIPASFAGLKSLDMLELYANALEGPIPSWIDQMSNLRVIHLVDNRMSGPLPPELGNLPRLLMLKLGGNALTGPVPDDLVHLTALWDGWSMNSWNGLFSDNPEVDALLSRIECCGWDWKATQTIAPATVAVGAVGPDSVELSWTPIAYTADPGGYRVLYSTSWGGPYELFGMTANKAENSMTVTGLDDGVTYYFVVQTVTHPHTYNKNTVESEYSAEVSATTIALNQPPVVEAGSGLAGVEGQLVELMATFVDPNPDDTHAAVVDWGDGGVDPGVVSESGGSGSVSGTHAYAQDSGYVVTVTVIDDSGESGSDTTQVNIGNVAPVVGAISAPVDPIQVGAMASASAEFSDPGRFDTHTASWSWGDGSSSPGVVVESNGAGTVTGDHVYVTPGVYTVTLTVADDSGATGDAEYRYVVVFDPEGGFVTGGGWITSPPGAYVPDPTMTGRATFGFVSKYKSGSSVPTGTTEFQFHAASFNFRSTSYQWLVVAGAKAKFKGEGEINGGGSYGFMLSATDGALPGGGGSDKFRIKIWDKVTDVVVYDNQLGAPDDADPTTVIGGGSIVIHKS